MLVNKRKEPLPVIRPKSRIEVAAEYGISPKTLRRRLAGMDIRLPPGRIVPSDLRQIYRKLGIPPFAE